VNRLFKGLFGENEDLREKILKVGNFINSFKTMKLLLKEKDKVITSLQESFA
jgi:hypothetical protein